jgi:hypothetical protein
MRAIEPRKRLDRFDAGQRLVDKHRVKEQLVVAGLELVRANEEAIGVFFNFVGDLI